MNTRVENPTPSDQSNQPHHERIVDPLFRRAVDLLDAGDTAGLQAHLKQYPNLSRQRVTFEGANYFRNPTLLEFVAENPIRHGKLPANIVAITKIILDAGTEPSARLNETLSLVSSGRVPRECHVQLPLIDLLCDHGADPNSAMLPALTHGEFEAANALIQRGAQINLPVAAALGRTEALPQLLPRANSEDRHRSLALQHHSSATSKSFASYSTQAKIQTATTPSAPTPNQLQCIKPPSPDTTKSSSSWSNEAQERTLKTSSGRAPQPIGHITEATKN